MFRTETVIIKNVLLMSLCLILLPAAAGCASGGETEEPLGDPTLNEDGGDWRSTGLYSNTDTLSDTTYIYFLDLDGGYSIYTNGVDSDDEPGYICDLYVSEEETGFRWDDISSDIVVEDLDGDGTGEIGLAANDGTILWYRLDPENYTCEFLEAEPK